MKNSTTNNVVRSSFVLTGTVDQAEAARIAERAGAILNGQTFFDFLVEWGIGPTCFVNVYYNGEEEREAEAQGMALMLMAEAL